MEEQTKTELQYEKRDSVTLKRNAKGEYAWDAKIYFDAEGGNEEILERLVSIDAGLRKQFLEA